MMNEFPQSLEMCVLEEILGSFRSQDEWEAERPDHVPPYDETRTMFQNLAAMVHQQGLILARLSVVPSTRVDLMTRMPDLLESAPTWLDAHLQTPNVMTLELFMRGLAETMTVHRREIERVLAEQVTHPEEIEKVLADSPIPAGGDQEERSDLIKGVSHAMTAHTEALVDIAYDIDLQFRRFAEPNES